MANTLNFGNGKWATKKDGILGFNNVNANFKPLSFVTSRASTATVINQAGLIENVGNGIPRVDYVGNTKGAYLLEPQSTNLLVYSNDFSRGQWSKSNSSVESGFASPSKDIPLGAFRFNLNASGYMFASATTTKVVGSKETISIFSTTNTDGIFCKFGGSTLAGTDVFKKETLSSGWFRYSVTRTFTAAATGDTIMSLSFSALGTGQFIIYGAQLEQEGSATSLINTDGGVQTRLVDNFNASIPSSDTFNSTNGFTFFGTFESSGGGGTSSMMLQFNNNLGYVGFGHNGTNWRTRINNSSTNVTDITNISLLKKSSLSIAINPTDYSIFANGAEQTSGTLDLSGSTIPTSISFRSGAEFGVVRISDLRMYNTKLTTAELTTLTSI